MKKTILHFLFLALFPLFINAQNNTGTLSFFTRSSDNGYGIKSSIQITGKGETFNLQTDEAGHFEFIAKEGKYDVLVQAEAFNSIETYFVIEIGKPVTIEILLDPREKKLADNTLYSYAAIEGYVVDYSSGKPMRNVSVFMDENNVAVTDENGFFSVISNDYSNIQSPEDKAVRKTFRFSQPNYSSYVVEDLLLLPTKTTLKITLKKGEETDTHKYFQRTLDGTTADDELYIQNNSLVEKGSDAVTASGCIVPSSIRVGTSCSCTSCTGVSVMSLQYYSESGLDDEWISSWQAASLQAGSIAYRTYGAWNVNHPVKTNFDIASSTCNQVWGSALYGASQSAAQVTTGLILTADGVNPVRSEYSAENNQGGTSINCANCFAGGSGGYACYSDNLCCGKNPAGHGRGMCQWGSQRWAQNSQTYSWIINHYYIVPIGYSLCSSVNTPLAPTYSVNAPCGSKTLARATPPTGTTYYWQGTTCGTSTANSALTYVVSTSGTYYLRARNSAGLWSTNCSSLSVTINALPANAPAPTLSPNSCGSATLTRATPPAGVTYFWQTACGTSTVNSSLTYSTTTSGTLRLRARSSASCWSPTCTAVAFTVSPIPSPTITGLYSVCSDAIGVGYSSPNTTNVFLWTINGGTISAGQNTHSVSVNWGTSTGGALTLKETNPLANCSKTVTFNSTIYSNPAIPTITQTGSVISSSSTSGNQWFLNNVIISGATSQTYTVTQNGYYTVVTTNSSTGCSTSSDPFNYSTVGINEGATKMNSIVNIYPNPSQGAFTIQFPMPISNIKIHLINVLGQSINFTEIKKSETEMMIENVVPGAYIFQIIIDNKQYYNKKVIVN